MCVMLRVGIFSVILFSVHIFNVIFCVTIFNVIVFSVPCAGAAIQSVGAWMHIWDYVCLMVTTADLDFSGFGYYAIWYYLKPPHKGM